MSAIDTIIFDLGGVLVDWNPTYIYKNIFTSEEKMNWFFTNVCTPEWNMEQDAGRTIAEGEKILIDKYPEYENEIKHFYKEWEFMLNGVIEENFAILNKLKASKKYKIYALTNWSAEKWDKAVELFPFFNEFDGVVVSGHEKCRKPFPEIYNIILNRYNINAKKAVFIDDNLDNVEAARKLGINGIHFTANSNLKLDLTSFNI